MQHGELEPSPAAGPLLPARGPAGSWWQSLSPLPAVLIAVAGLDELVAGRAYPIPLVRAVVSMAAPAGVLVAATILYQLVIRWNRVVAGSADPGDWLNGLGGVLVGASIGNALAGDLWSSGSVPAAVGRQLGMLAVGATLVLIGACVSVAMLARLGRDVRFWLILVSAGCLLVSSFLVLLLPDRTVGCGLGCFAASGLVMLCRRLPDAPGEPVPASLQATSSGSIIVMGAAVVMLAVSPFLGSNRLVVTVYAGVAIPCVGTRLVRLVRDLEELARARAEALTDDLTGIANRRSLLADLHGYLDRGRSIMLIVLDLDDFKLVNDRYGHGVGDDVLREVTRIFLTQLPRRARLARLGGDEFAVLLPGASDAQAVSVGRRLVDAPAGHRDLGGRALRVRASVGIAGSAGSAGSGMARDPVGAITATELMRRADTAMYQAKNSGEGVAVYDQALDALAREQLDLAEELREVLDAGSARVEQVHVHFQPQLETRHGTVVGAEALVRWQHPRLGLLTPDRFLPLVEREGLMFALTARVLEVAAGQWQRLCLSGIRIRVSVNLSPSCLGRPELLRVLDGMVTRGVDPRAFVLEVTETSVMADPESAVGAMKDIVARGFEISIDDYGTGYSSLSYLNDLPASELKIDRSFTERLLADDRTTAIVAGTVELAHRLGMRLVAEGVQDTATLAILRDLGCDESQGYLHARPMPADELGPWLRSRLERPADQGGQRS